ncbi:MULTISPECIES: NADPH:quinone reductase [unclassified Haladaptatus]|uniref:NADPH:quinone reductase n=2 Tax=Haladaptatus TaxID=367188 RepID=UPI0023E77612|nr:MULTISPECIES: NADPH:quinone reductase [unclassified Haladaptatus]
MRAIRYHEYGDESVLSLDEVPKPNPGAGEVRVAIEAASVNPIDAKLRSGLLEPTAGLPHVCGVDLAGVVDAVGAGVTRLEPGDRVYGTGFGWKDDGTYAEYAAVPAARLATLPDAVSFETGAAAALVCATAWRGLVTRGDLRVGETCLVHGASGGVGHVAVQIAVNAGATVVGTARGEEATAFVEGLGATAVVDYREDDLADAVRASLAGRPVDVVLDSHADKHIETDLAAVGRGGRVVVIGQGARAALTPERALAAMFDDADIRFMSIMASMDDQRRVLTAVSPLLAAGSIDPVIEAAYPLAEAADAMAHAASPGVLGKIVIETTE